MQKMIFLLIVLAFTNFTFSASYKSEIKFEERLAEFKKISAKRPDSTLVICERAPRSQLKELEKKKLLLPKDMTVSELLYFIRGKITLSEYEALFVFIGGVMAPPNALISELYEKHKEADGFLYVLYAEENTFG